MIAALFVETGGVYYGLEDVDPWDEERDARDYKGPYPVVAHPPCKRWGRFWHGSPMKPHQYQLGDDNGCFAAALEAVETFGGIIEHPADSHAWDVFGLRRPSFAAHSWTRTRVGWTAYVEQGFYGHVSRKPTWLYAVGIKRLPELRYGRGEQRLNQDYLERHGYEKARRAGILGAHGGGGNDRKRSATPIAFRDLLLSMVRGGVTQTRIAWT